MVGNFTKAFGQALGCSTERKPAGEKGEKGGSSEEIALRQILPRVYIDGPFGSASEDVFKFEVAVLCGAGIGVTPFASILKSIWYRMNYPQGSRTRLRKVYFFWICRDFGSFEWFRSLLLAIEAQDIDDHIEIHTVCLIYIIDSWNRGRTNHLHSTLQQRSRRTMRPTS
jgi:NADPH oxidase